MGIEGGKGTFNFSFTLNHPPQAPQAKNFILVPNLRIVAKYEGI